MKTNTTILTATLLAIGSSAFALTNDLVLDASRGSVAHPQEEPDVAILGEAEALAAEYAKADEAFRGKLRVADRDQRKALKANHPVKEFWPRFEALAANNDGVALLWMADHIKANKSIKRSERPKVLLPIYTALVEHHGEAEWFPRAMQSLARNAKSFEAEQVTELVKTAVGNAKAKAQRGRVLYLGARALIETDPKTARKYIDEIIDQYPKEHVYTAAVALITTTEDVQKGKLAPDFLGESRDGFKFNLSDYRGKVVVLDFYGFW